ncbi:MAG: hypothetical protein R2706_15520 [Acidimicrobiales bacterium]
MGKETRLDVVVADLPDGVDPGELAQKDPERLALAVKNAQSFLGFRERALAAGDMRTVEGRAKPPNTHSISLPSTPTRSCVTNT